MDGTRRFPGLTVLLAGEVAVVSLLHRLGGLPWLRVGWDDPGRWLATVPPEDAVMAALRLVALAGAYWLLVTTVGYLVARATRLPAALRAVQWATLPAVRRVADGAVAAVLVGSSMTLGAMPVGAVAVPPAAVPAPAVPAPDGVVLPPALTKPDAVSGGPERAAAGPAAGDPAPDSDAPPSATATPDPATHMVVAGDNLWAIAAADLAAPASPAEIHARWRAVIEANRHRLRSGDPDLIFPGERILLPSPHPRAG